MRISDWSSDVCSSDLVVWACRRRTAQPWFPARDRARCPVLECQPSPIVVEAHPVTGGVAQAQFQGVDIVGGQAQQQAGACGVEGIGQFLGRSEEHTSELQSLMRISYYVLCLK